MNIYRVSFLFLVCFTLISTGTAVLAYQNPTANAGPDLYLTTGQIVTLQGSGYDPNGFLVNYYWTCNRGTLSSYNVAQPVYFAPSINNYNEQATYTCTLTVTNNYGNSGSDSMMIFINGNNNNSNYYGSNYVQTNPATNMSNGQATLEGYLNFVGTSNTYVWFQYGPDMNYGKVTTQQKLSSTGAFNQIIGSLNSNMIYHFRSVAQGSFGTVYGQDMTFVTTDSPINVVPPVIYTPPVATYNTGQVFGASAISTGLTNNFFTDSFFLPLFLLLLSAWLYFSGKINIFAYKLKAKLEK